MKTSKNRNALAECYFCEAIMRSDNIARHCQSKHGKQEVVFALDKVKNEYRKKLHNTRTKPSNAKIACTCLQMIVRKDMAKHKRTNAHKHKELVAELKRKILKLQW